MISHEDIAFDDIMHDETTKHKPVKVMALSQVVGSRTLKPKIHACTWPGCTSAFNRKPDMVRHVRGYHEKKKDHHCTFPGCGRSFGQATTLATHENIHTGAKPYQCGYCRRRFGDQSSCSRHQREQHVGMKYFCPFCKSANKRNTEFYKHLQSRHQINKDDINVEIYKLPKHFVTEDLAVLPQFNLPGMNGIEARRNLPHQRRSNASSSTTFNDAHAITRCGLITMPRARSTDSLATTPALSSTSVSPSPSFSNSNLCYEGISAESSQQIQISAYADPPPNNYLGIDFNGGVQAVTPAHVYTHDMSYSPEPTYAGMQHNPFATFNKPYAYDFSMDNIAPQLFGASGYDANVTLGMAPAQDPYPGEWQPYMTPISQMARSTHAQVSAWSQGI